MAITASNSASQAGTMTCAATGTVDSAAAIAVGISGGAGQVAWVVQSIDPTYNYQKTISFGVAISYTPNTTLDLPGLTSNGGVTGALGPLSLIDYAVPTSTSTGDIPRFRDKPYPAQIFSIVPCVTNILFPYVTVKAGFDTGIALVNTSLDSPVLATQTQHGVCKMYYFDGATTGTPAAQTSCDVKAGAMITFSMMTQGGIPSQTCADGSTVTNTAVPIGWQGYAIASCNFQYGRGFAFISDRNTPSLGSQGYLPLILSACTSGRSPNAFDGQPSGITGTITNEGTTFNGSIVWNNCGEMLGM